MTITIDRDTFSIGDVASRVARRAAYAQQLAEARDALREAEQAFRTEIRATVEGMASERGDQEIDADLDELEARGRAIGQAAKALELANRRANTYQSATPAKLVATLMCESFDHLMQAQAWHVVVCAAELEAIEP